MPLIVFSIERKEVRKIKLILQSINDYLPNIEQGLEFSLGGPPLLSCSLPPPTAPDFSLSCKREPPGSFKGLIPESQITKL